ncbi:hypothetical protein PR202_ga29134 [Eleusine coracana subsp. coracana]|uniref:DUF6598 domain-containing protein n=1 Tax=Eleusine coracana subsp. coracana TaxID=191504 RepID=A0AAV5DL98_ELECO|nr:hypothetical protein PR202_ga29134 [Eleusine coracana subsp. coracana]
MGEPEELTWWERFVDGLEEAVSECPVKKNEALRGEEGWKKNEMDLLSLLYSRVLDQKSEECEEVYRKRMMVESGGGSEEKGLDESGLDIRKVTSFREYWKSQWQGLYGSFEDVNLRWPLHVFGVVALRDHVDRNRNLLFYSTRDNCQTLSETDPYLILTGPTRPVVVTKDDPVMIEVYLKVKGDTENEDKYLVYFADNVQDSVASYIAGVSADNLYPILCPSKHAMLEVRVGEIRSSVEATIFVRVAKGLLWPGGFHGHFAARTSSERQSVVLFDFGADMVPVDGDGYMKLSRHVVSVELEGSLQVYFMAWPDHKSFKACQECNEVVNGEVRLNPEKAGRSYANFRLGSFEMEVIVAWSLVVPDPQPDVPDSFENYPHRA